MTQRNKLTIIRTFSRPVAGLLSTGAALAQRPPSDAGCAACAGCGISIPVIIIGLIALNIALLVWVARDAKARGMDSSVLWMLLVFFTGLIGLLIYIFARTQGDLVRCASCGNNRLQAAVKCPHCGNA